VPEIKARREFSPWHLGAATLGIAASCTYLRSYDSFITLRLEQEIRKIAERSKS
jgi:hypothetical protein